jgi:hypothetical protein
VTLSSAAPGKAPVKAAAITLPRDNATTTEVSLQARQAGLQLLDIDDGTAGTRLNWPLGTPFTIEMSHDRQHDINGAATLYFYVPKGTRVVAGYQKNLPGELLAPDGSSRLTFANDNVGTYWSVPVKAGEDGKLWEMSGISGSGLQLLTVPPLLARNAGELLLPREVVAADSR